MEGKLQHRVAAWATTTFPNQTTDSILLHLIEEVLELYGLEQSEIAHIQTVILTLDRNPQVDYPNELGDVGMLALTAADFLGYDLDRAIANKLDINKRRQWADGPHGYHKHT